MGDAGDDAGVRAGPLRWGNRERNLVNQLFQRAANNPADQQGMDYRRVHDHTYLRDFHQHYDVFKRHPTRNFYQNVRRMASDFGTEIQLAGARNAIRAAQQGNPAANPAAAVANPPNPPALPAAAAVPPVVVAAAAAAGGQGGGDDDDEGGVSLLPGGRNELDLFEEEDEDEDYNTQAAESNLRRHREADRERRQGNRILRLSGELSTIDISEPLPESTLDQRMMFHYYTWHETTLPGSHVVPLGRCTVDVLLPGPTSNNQITAQVIRNGMFIELKYTPCSVFINARRTAVRTGASFSGHRIMCHDQALQQQLHDNGNTPIQMLMTIPLPERCDYALTTRDDYGNEGRHPSIDIAEYLHDDEYFRTQGKTVWILHIELTLSERKPTIPAHALQFRSSNFAIDPNGYIPGMTPGMGAGTPGMAPSKSDVRRTKEIYEEKAEAASQEGPNFELRDWLPQFIGKVGPAVAKYVLPTKEEKMPVKSSGSSGCALLFFGLARSFEAVYPTLQKNVLNSNPGCKIFFHTYDASTSYEDGTEVSIETNNIRLLIEAASGSVVETEEDFQSKRDTKKYLQFFPHEVLAWKFPDSLENMIRQWHSIESVWNVMNKYEMETETKFKRVGLFRLDVIYQDPIDINPIELESAVIPSMMFSSDMPYSQYNDRMFYGTRMYAEIWATDRFSSVDDLLYWQDHNNGMRIHKGLHSESFMYFLLREKWNLPISEKDICFKRVRATGKIKEWDCNSFGTPNDGLFVLGMHRSGTSLLTGLLEHGAGLVLPGNRIRPNAANPMGYFESQDVIAVNNMWLQKQGLTWDAPYKTIDVDDSSLTTFNSSHPFISSSICPDPSMDRYCNARDRVLNDYTRGYYRTWVIKDPRMCLTLRAWVDLLGSRQDNNFAILFTYRNPLEVARSLQNRKRDKVQNLSFGLKLWILYNQMAITNSRNMCRVVTSNEAMLQNPVNEIKRIGGSLAHKCNFKEYEYNEREILKFLNKDFMHTKEDDKTLPLKESQPCTVPPFNSTAKSTEERETEKALYREAMMIFCDLKSGKAFEDDYVWPYQLELNEATKTPEAAKTPKSSKTERRHLAVKSTKTPQTPKSSKSSKTERRHLAVKSTKTPQTPKSSKTERRHLAVKSTKTPQTPKSSKSSKTERRHLAVKSTKTPKTPKDRTKPSRLKRRKL